MKTQPRGSPQSTYDAVFQQPVACNLHWGDVRSMLGALAEIVQQPNGNLKVTRNRKTLILHPSRDKDFADVAEVTEIRHFLERSGASSRAAVGEARHLLVVIDHREARVYETELHGCVPQCIMPYDPHGLRRHLHYVQDDSNGQRRPERKSFYEAVAKTLKGAEKILLFGSGTGASSAMEQLLIELKYHHPAVARRIVASIVIDAQHMSDDQLLAKAREVYAKIAS